MLGFNRSIREDNHGSCWNQTQTIACYPSGLWERVTDLKVGDEDKKAHGHFKRIRLNNFTLSILNNREQILNPI